MADDAAEVLRANHIGSAHVVGFSGGSVIAQELALRHPERVRTLVLQSTWTAMDPYLRTWAKYNAASSHRAVGWSARLDWRLKPAAAD